MLFCRHRLNPWLRCLECVMEGKWFVKLWTYLLLGLVVLHVGHNFVGTCNLIVGSDSGENDVVSHKYLTQLYFEKYKILLDSDFEDYLSYGLRGSCKTSWHSLILAPRLSVQRELVGEGSHRRLRSLIKFHEEPVAASAVPLRYQVIIVERLPSGVFADPFELQHLVQRSVFSAAAVFGDTNLELPSALSDRSVVEIHMDIGHVDMSRQVEGLELKLELPLHARYPPLDSTGYAVIQMGAPNIYLRYNIEENLESNSCLSRTTLASLEMQIDMPVWKIPSGNKAHSGLVSIVTFVSALVSTLLIVVTALFPRNIKNLKKL